MTIKILQTICTEKNIGMLNEKYHSDCIEYLPEAKGKDYELGTSVLIVKMDKSTDESKNIVNSQSFMRLFGAINHSLDGNPDLKALSISYPPEMEENASRNYLIVTVLVNTDNEISNAFLDELAQNIENDIFQTIRSAGAIDEIVSKKESDKKPTPDIPTEPPTPSNVAPSPDPTPVPEPTSVPEPIAEKEEPAPVTDLFGFGDIKINENPSPDPELAEKTDSNPNPVPEQVPDMELSDQKENPTNVESEPEKPQETEVSPSNTKNSNTEFESLKFTDIVFDNSVYNAGLEEFLRGNANKTKEETITEMFSDNNDSETQLQNEIASEETVNEHPLVADEEMPTASPETETASTSDPESIIDNDSDEPDVLETEAEELKAAATNSINASVFKTKEEIAKSKIGNETQNKICRPVTEIDYVPEIPNSQIEAYEAATTDIPFLNMIDEYIPATAIEHLSEETPLYEIHDDDYYEDTVASKKKFYNAFTKIVKEMTGIEHLSLEKALKDPKAQESLRDDIERFMDASTELSVNDRTIMLAKVENALLGYYVLKNVINDEKVSDIRVLSYDNINVKVHGDHYRVTGLSFIDEEDYQLFVNRVIVRHGVSVNYPILVFTDTNFHPDYILRFNLCLGMINKPGTPYLHIRKVPKNKTTLDKLKQQKMLDDKIANYLLDKVTSSRGIVFSGPSASGKTTLMNALIDYIPKEKSILCIQESEELFSDKHPNAYFQHIIKDSHGQTLIGLSELGQNGLLCDSGYFIIGECKGAEVRDLLRASNTGHKCWCSVHAQSSQETIPRLADYVKYGSDYSLIEATRMLKDLEVIVYIQNYRVIEISEIVGYDEDTHMIQYKSIYKRNYQPEEEE